MRYEVEWQGAAFSEPGLLFREKLALTLQAVSWMSPNWKRQATTRQPTRPTMGIIRQNWHNLRNCNLNQTLSGWQG